MLAKSSVARALAQRLGFHFLDTGAMYRAVAWTALRDGINLEDCQAMTDIARSIKIEFDNEQLHVDGQNVSEEIRSTRVTEYVKYAAGNTAVRKELVKQQSRIGASVDNLVTEGRDQGTTVFPRAECKIYLTATAKVRAKRRWFDLRERGEEVTLDEVLNSQNKRDAQDSARKVGPLARADDAIEVYTDDMTQEQVLNHLVWVVESTKKSSAS